MALSNSTETHEFRNARDFDFRAADPGAEAALIADQKTKIAKVCAIIRGLAPRAHIAEVGSFTGIAATDYAKLPGVEHITCYDLSGEAVKKCIERGLEAEVWHADTEPCPATEGTFDVVIALDVIEHMIDTERFLKEIRRVCVPQGHLILSTPNLAFWLSRLRLLLGRPPWSYPGVSSHTKVDPAIDLNHIRVNTLTEWRHLLAACGWNVTQVLTYSLLDDAQNGFKKNILHSIDRIARFRLTLAYGHIYLARSS
ncbi:MAG: hypothetical protein DMF74_24915 [Acidobacteria bacterium]|nr:MAG: hypothetical protein DMF74_24915 [Acidobacteriota bacterium]